MHVTVCISTRNRGGKIVATLRSVAASDLQDYDVVIVDQSGDNETALAVQPIAAADSRIRYVHSSGVGASRARNECIRLATGPIVAFTDDDCEVTTDWLTVLVREFHEHPEVGQICGTVVPGGHDFTRGFVPDYRVGGRRQISSPWQKWREGGIGANMAFHLSVLHKVGLFDEALGAGGQLYACEDGDMTYRVLRAGYSVLELPDARVTHHGFRTWAEGQRMMLHTGTGVGAAYMKHLRLGDLAVLPTLLYEWARCISWRRLLLLQKRSGVRRFIGYLLGMVASFRYQIDPREKVYVLVAPRLAQEALSEDQPSESAAVAAPDVNSSAG